MVSDVSVKDQIRQLVGLQKIDAEIYQLKKELKEKPEHLQEQDRLFEAKRSRLKQAEEEFKALQVKRQGLEKDLQAEEEKIAKSNTQLSQIKTNREYTAKLKEIESQKADKSIIEEKILLAYDEVDTVKAAVEKERAALSREEEEYKKERKVIEDSIRDLEAKVNHLESQRAGLVSGVDKALLARYERILANKEGLALVPINGDVCGGCFMNIPPQGINEVKAMDKVILCEMCARIIYSEEDL